MLDITLHDIIDGIGMTGFAVAGLIAVQNRRMDPVGVFVAIFTTAFGGGIIRDTMLDLRPYYWMSHPQWIWLAFVLTIFAPPLIRRMRSRSLYAINTFADAVGLAFFTVGSTATAWDVGQNAFVSVLLGVTTGCFGGLLRDVFSNRLPAVLSDREPYATIAFAGAWLYLGLSEWCHLPQDIALWVSCLLIIAARLVCAYLPTIRVMYFDGTVDPDLQQEEKLGLKKVLSLKGRRK